MATQADGLTSSVPDPLSEVLGCGLDSGDDRRQAEQGPEPERMRTTPNTMPGRPKPARQPQRQTGPPRKQPAKPP